MSMIQTAAILVTVIVAPLVAGFEDAHHHQGMRMEVKPGDDPTNAFRDAQFRRDKDHIQEHMGGRKIDLENATPEELDFHFFKIHDINGDNKLDGLELHSAMSHAFEAQMGHIQKMAEDNPTRYQEHMAIVNEHIIKSTDKILEELDEDNDGFIVYMEYTKDIRIKKHMNHVAQHYSPQPK